MLLLLLLLYSPTDHTFQVPRRCYFHSHCLRHIESFEGCIVDLLRDHTQTSQDGTRLNRHQLIDQISTTYDMTSAYVNDKIL